MTSQVHDSSFNGLLGSECRTLGNNIDNITKIVCNANESLQRLLAETKVPERDSSNTITGTNNTSVAWKNVLGGNKSTQTEGVFLSYFDTSQSSNEETTNTKILTGQYLCRLCADFHDRNQMVSIYDKLGKKKQLEKMINSTLTFKITEMDGLPQQICNICVQKLTCIYQAVVVFEKANMKLQRMIPESLQRNVMKELTNTDTLQGSIDSVDQPGTSSLHIRSQVSSPKSSPSMATQKEESGSNNRRKQQHKVLKEPEQSPLTSVDLSLLDPEHGSGLQVEWCLVRNSPPRQKYTCKRTPVERGASPTGDLENSQISLESEIKKEYNENTGSTVQYECPSCSLIFPTQSEAFLHKLRKHAKEIPGVYIHNERKVLPSKKQTDTPSSKIDKEGDHKCNVCDMSFKNEYGLYIHKTTVHDNSSSLIMLNVSKLPIKKIGPYKVITPKAANVQETAQLFKCPFCSSGFLNQLEIDKHCEEVHGRYMCKLCENIFYHKTEYMEHMDSHNSAPPNNDNSAIDDASPESPGSPLQETEQETELPDMNSSEMIAEVESYDCNVCNKKFTQNNLLQSHLRLHNKQEEYECATCDQIFHDKILLANHVQTHLPECPFECNKCERKFPTSMSLKEHCQEHMENICGICSDVFSTRQALEVHNQKAHKYRLPYTCRVCGKGYPNAISLRSHKIIHKKKRGDHVCTVCRKRFFLEKNLERHMIIHPGRRHYKCILCFKSFQNMGLLLKHKAVHLSDKSIICRLCYSYFSSLSSLLRHRLESHSTKEIEEAREKNAGYIVRPNEEKFQCDICDKILQTKQSFQNHMMLHNPDKPYECQKCKRYYLTQQLLDKHMRCHMGEAPFQCPTCGRKCQSKRSLTQHMLIHTDELKHTCQICDKKFRLKQSLKAHIASHGEKKHHCLTCKRPYKHKNSMLKHYNSKVCKEGDWEDTVPLNKSQIIPPEKSSPVNGSVHESTVPTAKEEDQCEMNTEDNTPN